MRRRAVPDSRLQAGSSLGAQCNRSAGPAPSSSSKATTARASTGCTTGRTASSTATPRRGRGPGAGSQPRSRTWRATGVTEASSTTTGYCSWRVGIPALPSHTALLWRRRGVNRGAPCCAEPVPMHTCVLGRPPRLPVSPSPRLPTRVCPILGCRNHRVLAAARYGNLYFFLSFGPFITYSSAMFHPTHAVLLRVHACWALIGGCNPTL